MNNHNHIVIATATAIVIVSNRWIRNIFRIQ